MQHLRPSQHSKKRN